MNKVLNISLLSLLLASSSLFGDSKYTITWFQWGANVVNKVTGEKLDVGDSNVIQSSDRTILAFIEGRLTITPMDNPAAMEIFDHPNQSSFPKLTRVKL